MGDAMGGRYWCHMCSQMVNPTTGVELKCPHCDGGFVEEMDARGDMDDQALSLWAPILLGMLGGGTLRRRRVHRDQERENPDQERDREIEALRRRRRRTSAVLQLLQTLRQGNRPESDDGAEGERRRRQDHVILINPFSQAVMLQGSPDAERLQREGSDSNGDGIPVGDYFLGTSLDVLLQRLVDNDPNRYGTPPAMKEAVDAMPTVTIEKSTSGCSICLEEFEVGGEAREMPCKHRFHGKCILPWLEVHSSCPVCRFQMPADVSKVTHRGGGSRGERSEIGGGGESVPWATHGGGGSGGERSEIGGGGESVPWAFDDLLYLSGPPPPPPPQPPSSAPGSSNSEANGN